MGDNLFVPLAEFRKNNNGDQSKATSLEKVVKKSNVHTAGEHPIEHERTDQQHGITCIPNIVDGKVSSIDVECACGQTTRIILEYGNESP